MNGLVFNMKNEVTIADFIRRATDRVGVVREKFTDNNLPDTFSDLIIIPFFGDIRSEFLLSTLLLHHLKKTYKYLIIVSYTGHSGLYPYVDEFWSVKDESALASLSDHVKDFCNTSQIANTYERSLLRYFENVKPFQDSLLNKWYNNGFTSKFLKDNDFTYQLPLIPSVNMDLSRIFVSKTGQKVFIYPCRKIRVARGSDYTFSLVKEDFWVDLVERLIKEKMVPVLYQNYATYDLSSTFDKRCAYITESDLTLVLGAMRACDCVLDIFSGISRYAIIARSPFVCFDDRQRYVSAKEYEIDELCASDIPHQIVYSFSAVLENNQWNNNIIDLMMVKLKDFLPKLDRNTWTSTLDVMKTLSYADIKKRETKRIGSKFIKPLA